MSKVIELTDQTFRSSVEKARLSFVDFYASWCGPCRLFAPVFEKVANESSAAFFFKIDGDKNPESRQGLSIDNLPYIAVYGEGRFLDSISTTNEDAFRAFVVRLIKRWDEAKQERA